MQKYQYYTLKKYIKNMPYYSIKSIPGLYEVWRRQSDPHSLLIKFEGSICLSKFLKMTQSDQNCWGIWKGREI